MTKQNTIGDDINRQTKIVTTLGPVTTEVAKIKDLLHAGANVVRLNMSHGDHKEHGTRLKNTRLAAEDLGVNVGVLVDLSGPKIRTGELATPTVELVPGKKITLVTNEILGTAERLTVRYENLSKEVKVGGFIMLDDGRRKLLVEKIEGKEIICKIIIGGVIKPRRGVNMPGSYLSISAVTEKDKEDLKFAIKNKVEYIALSFVRTGDDVKYLKSLLPKNYKPLIISKIETEEALENIENILSESDGIMVARGDLAIEIPRENVPVVQKSIIMKAVENGKIVITATQMLESMIKSPVPTRAEVSDIANAIFDGTDAVMLSEESAMGEYAKEAVEMMHGVALATDSHVEPYIDIVNNINAKDFIKRQAALLADDIDAKAIITFTETGATPMKIASFKSGKPVIAITKDKVVADRLSIVKGIKVIIRDNIKSFDELIASIKTIIKENKIANKGESVVVISGMSFGKSGANEMVFVETI